MNKRHDSCALYISVLLVKDKVANSDSLSKIPSDQYDNGMLNRLDQCQKTHDQNAVQTIPK